MLLRPSPQEIVLGRLTGSSAVYLERLRDIVFGERGGWEWDLWRVEGVLYNKEESCWLRFRLMGIFEKQKNVRIRKIRTQDTRYHPTFACGEYTTGALTADDALIAKRKQPWGEKSAHSITGVSGFSYVYRFSRHYGGGYTRAASPAYVGGKTSFQKSGSGTTSTNTAKALHRPASLCAQWLRVLRPINAMWI